MDAYGLAWYCKSLPDIVIISYMLAFLSVFSVLSYVISVPFCNSKSSIVLLISLSECNLSTMNNNANCNNLLAFQDFV